MAFTTAQDFIDVWAELDSAYVTFPTLASVSGNYQDDTQVDTSGAFAETLNQFGATYGFTLDSASAKMGQLALAVNTLFVELANSYVDWLDAGNPPILDIAKDRGGAPAPGQTFHDNILGNLGDGPISGRFGSADEANNVDIDGDSVGDLNAEPRTVAAQEFGDRPYVAGSSSANMAEALSYDLEKGVNITANYVQRFSQSFESGTSGFLDGDSGWNGQVSQVSSGTDGIVSPDGGFHAIFEQDVDGAPFTRFANYGQDFGDGHAVSTKIYLNQSWADGEGFDWSVAASNSEGSHLRDFVFHITKDADTGTVLIGADNNTNFDPINNLETRENFGEVTQSGWYTFNHVFFEASDGSLAVAMTVLDENGDAVFHEVRNEPSDAVESLVGGSYYGWFTNIDIAGGIAVDDVELRVSPGLGTEGVDTLVGTDGDDLFIASASNDSIDGGDGVDTYDLSANNTAGAFVDLQSGLSFGGTETGIDSLSNIENIRGGSGLDLLNGDGQDNTFFLSGGADQIDGRGGSDTVDASAQADSVSINLAAGTYSGNGLGGTFSNIENATGGEGSDTLNGNASANVLSGNGGDDRLTGGAGDDTLNGGDGIDTAVFAGDQADYDVALGSVSVTDTNAGDGDDGVDSADDIEILEFADARSLIVGDGGFDTIEEALAEANDGDTILLSAGTHTLSGQLSVDKEVTIVGQGEGQTTLVTAATSWGVLVTADNVSISDLTVDASATTIYGVKVQPDDTGDAADSLTGFAMENVTVQGAGRSEIDLNGVDDSSLTNVTADGQGTAGVGIALSDSTNITLTDITTTGNDWGSVGLFSAGNVWEGGTNTITFEGSYSHDEPTGIYADEENGTVVDQIDVSGIFAEVFKVKNDSYRADADDFTFFFDSEADAAAFALGLAPADDSIITGPHAATDVDNANSSTFIVVEGMSIQEAIDKAQPGDTIEVRAGVYAENLTIDKALTFTGTGDVSIEPASGTAIFIAPDVDGDISFDGIDLEGNGAASLGIDVQHGANVGTLSFNDGSVSGFANRGLYASDDGDPDGTPTMANLVITNAAFADNGTGSGNTADIKLFGYSGDATFDTVTFDGQTTGDAEASAGKPDNAIELTGFINSEGNANPVGANAPDIGAVTIENVTVSGEYHKNPIAIFNFGEIDGLDIIGLDLSGAESAWGPLFNIDGFSDLDIDASGFGITFPATSAIHAEIQGEKDAQGPLDSTITGTSGNDSLHGKDGDDTLNGGDGDDFLYGGNKPGQPFADGAGDDTLNGGAGADTLVGGIGADTLDGGAGADIIDAGAGDDIIIGDLNDALIDGGDGLDTMTFEAGTLAADVIAKAADISNVELIRIGETPGSDTWVVLDGMSIQDAIDAAADGDTIVAGPGSFTENLLVDKGVTLLGAQAGESATGAERSGGESVIDGPATFAITVTSDDVTIDGFEISGFGRDGVNVRTLEDADPSDPSVGAYRSNVSIENNWIHNDDASGQRNGIVVGEFSGDPARSTEQAEIDGLTVSGNHIDIDSSGGRAMAFTNHFDFITLTDAVIDGNTFDAATSFFGSAGPDTFRIENAALTGNTFEGTVNSYNLFNSLVDGNTFNGIALFGVDGSTVSNNVFNVDTFYGLGLWGDDFGSNASQNSTVEGNTFNYNSAETPDGYTADYLGAMVFRAGVDAGSITIDGNTFNDGGVNTDIVVFELQWRGNDGADTLDQTLILDGNGDPVDLEIDFRGNDGEDTIVGDLGDSLFDGGDGVDTLVFAADVLPADIIGQPAPTSNVEIIRIGDTPGSNTFVVLDGMSIQDAIDAAADGDTIVLADGTFTGNVLLNKDVTLEGANAGVAGDGSRGAESIIEGVIQIMVDGASVDGVQVQDGAFVLGQNAGIYVQADNVTIENSVLNRSGTVDGDTFRGVITATGDGQGLTIDGNAFSGWATGVYLNPGSDAVVTNNLFDGNHVGLSNDGPDAANISGNSFNHSNVEHIGLGAFNDPTDVSGVIVANTFDDTADPVTIYALGGDGQVVTGTDGDDIFVDVGGDDDVFNGVDGDDTLNGGAGADTLDGGAGDDAIDGGAGDDTIVGDLDDSSVDGGDGVDTLAFAAGVLPADIIAQSGAISNVEIIRIGDTPGSNTFVVLDGMSIQDAIDAAADGDTIVVEAGDFTTGSVNITKSLTLLGANAGEPGSDGAGGLAMRGAETQILNSEWTISADDVEISGFEFSIEDASSKSPIQVANVSNVTISENIIQGGGANGGRGIEVISSFSGSLDVHENFIDSFSTGVFVNPVSGGSVVISSNVISNHVAGIGSSGMANATITNNYFADNSSEAIGADNLGAGVEIDDNSFSGPGSAGFLKLDYAGFTNIASADGNWFGSADAAVVEGLLSANVSVANYRDSGVDASGAAGFQPDGGLIATPVENVTQGSGAFTLSGALLSAQPGDELAVGAGDYAVEGAQLTIDIENLTFDVDSAAANFPTLVLASGVQDITLTGDQDVDVIGNGLGNAISGNAGDNTVRAGAGDDDLDGGAGEDTLDYSDNTSSVTVQLSTGVAFGGETGVDQIANFENLRGGSGSDTLAGDTGANTFFASSGNDQIAGGDGVDTYDASGSANAVAVLLNSGTAGGASIGNDTLTGIENAVGSAFNDTMVGDANANRLDGGAGNDNINGGDGEDSVFGGAGNDNIVGDLGSDNLSGGDGDDTLNGGRGFDTLFGNAGNDILFGGLGDDSLFGNAGDDQLFGGEGADALFGGQGNDSLDGGTGDDELRGNLGDDTLDGGEGDDTAVFSGARSEYTISYSGGSVIITDTVADRDGVDILTDIEAASFLGDNVTEVLKPELGDTPSPDLGLGGAGDDIIFQYAGGGIHALADGDAAQDAFLGNFATPLGVGDFDNDGVDDLLVEYSGGGKAFWSGGDQSSETFLGGKFASAIAVGDFTGGEGDDLIIEYGGGGRAVIDGETQVISFLINDGTDLLAVGDFDGDGKDEALTQFSGGGVRLLNGDGTTAFLGQSGDYRLQGDFDGDGAMEAVFQYSGGGSEVLGGDGSQTFLGSHGTAIAVGDFNGDGVDDILFDNAGSGKILYSADPSTSVTLGALGGDVAAIADLNGDGADDIVIDRGVDLRVIEGESFDDFIINVNADVVGVGDYNDDSEADLLLQFSGGGTVVAYSGDEANQDFLGQQGDVAGMGDLLSDDDLFVS